MKSFIINVAKRAPLKSWDGKDCYYFYFRVHIDSSQGLTDKEVAELYAEMRNNYPFPIFALSLSYTPAQTYTVIHDDKEEI